MIEAVIFDMDGVISDTQCLHAQVESEILKRYEINFTPEEITHKYAGVKTEEFFKELLDQQSKRYDLNEILDEKWQKMGEYASKSVNSIDGSPTLIKNLYIQYPLALASASNFNYVDSVLNTLKIKDYFSAIVTGNMVKNGKPDPESFLLAAKKINTKQKNCLVIEDGRSGMEAAHRANMYCIGLVPDTSKDYPTKNLVTHLSQITPEFIVRLQK